MGIYLMPLYRDSDEELQFRCSMETLKRMAELVYDTHDADTLRAMDIFGFGKIRNAELLEFLEHHDDDITDPNTIKVVLREKLLEDSGRICEWKICEIVSIIDGLRWG